MKKIVSVLTALIISFTLVAQSPVNEKKDGNTKNQTTDPKAVNLDGKTFKITFSSKTPGTKTVTGTETGTVNTVKSVPDQTGGNATTGREGKTNEETITDKAPGNPQNQAGLADLDHTNARLSFSGETITITLTNETPAVEGCAYRITSGTTDFATFTASCDKRAAMIPPVESKEMNEKGNGAATTGEVSTDQPAISNGSVIAAPAGTNTVAAFVTGLVNGNEISGTVIFKENGNRITYSYKGIADNKKLKKNDEMGMK